MLSKSEQELLTSIHTARSSRLRSSSVSLLICKPKLRGALSSCSSVGDHMHACLQCECRELWVKLSFSHDELNKTNPSSTSQSLPAQLSSWTTSPQPAQGLVQLSENSAHAHLCNNAVSAAQEPGWRPPQGRLAGSRLSRPGTEVDGDGREGGLWSASQQPVVRCCSAKEREREERQGEGPGARSVFSYLHLRRLQLLVHVQGIVMEPDLHKHLRRTNQHMLRM